MTMPVLLVLAVVSVIVGGAWLEVRNYHVTRQGALTTLRESAAALAQTEGNAFLVADTALRAIIAEYREVFDEENREASASRSRVEDRREQMKALLGALPQVAGLAIVGRHGHFLESVSRRNASDLEGRDRRITVDDRDYFRWFSDGPGLLSPQTAPFVGQPLRSRRDGSWFLGMSRAIHQHGEPFVGVAVAAFSVDWFRSVNDAVVLPKGTALALVTRQGLVVDALVPGQSRADDTGRPLEIVFPGLAADTVRRRGLASSGTTVMALDHGIAAVAPLPGVPLQVVLYRSWDAIMGVWHRQLVEDMALLSLAVMVLLGLGFPLLRALRDRDRLFDLSPDPVCVCDDEGRLLRVNASWGRLLGYGLDDLVGRRQVDIVHPDDVELVQRAQIRLHAGEAVEDVTIRYVCADGTTYLWLAWSAASEGGKLYIVARNISKRVAAENALRESEQRFRDVAEAASEFIWETDADGRLTYVSRRVRSVVALAPDDLRGRPFADLLLDEGAPRLLSALGRDVPFTIEVPMMRVQGQEPIWIRLSGQPVRDTHGTSRDEPPRHVGFRGVAEDITEARRARQALLDSEARYRGIVNTIVEAIVTIDDRGIVQSVNPAAERLFGYPAREMIGENVRVLMPEPIHGRHDNFIRAYLRTGVARMIGTAPELTARRSDGELFPMELGLSEVFLGNRRFFIGACRDLSERKRIERLKDEFVATVSHELRTPLTSIRGSLGLMAGGAVGELPVKAAGLVDIALANCARLSRLVDDILDFERIESGLLTFHMAPVDLSSVARKALDDLAPAMASMGVKGVLEAPPSGTPLILEGDFDRLLQMTANLMSNAVKFAPAGSTVRVEVGRDRDHGVLSVSDRGPGIPEDFIPHLFKRFSQADSSTKRGRGGSGLGLAIVRAIADRHGGTVEFVTSTKEPTGTTFTVRLPLATPAPAMGGGRLNQTIGDRT